MLSTIHGISSLSAEVILAEIRIDVSRFPSGSHLISWVAGLCHKTTKAPEGAAPTASKKELPG